MKNLYLLFASLLVGIYGLSQSWVPVGSGFDSYVSTLHFDTSANLLYAGGNFQNSDTTVLNHIGYWNGVQWNAMDIGMNQRVTDIEEYNGELYATGWFTTAGNSVANHIAKWDGNTWQDVGGGLDAPGLCMYVFNGNLYVGGFFTQAGTQPCKYVAYWDGSNWNSVDTNIVGTGWPVQSIFSYQGDLYIGGKFIAEGIANNIARLSGGIWQPLGGGTNSDVHSMQEMNGELIVTGYFNMVDTVGALCVAKWNGSNWSTMYGPMSSDIACQEQYNGNLIMGGAWNSFVNMGWGQLSPGIANYNVASQIWTGIDSGFSNYVRDLLVVGNSLYAGGAFDRAGNDSIHNIAQINISTLSISETNTKLISFFPNPANEEITIDVGTSDDSNHVVICNSMGQVIVEYYSKQKTIKIPTRDFAEGIYFLTLVNSTYTFAASLVIAH